MKLVQYRRLTAAIALSVAAGCSSSGGGDADTSTNGFLSIALTDAPVTDVAEIWIEITNLRIKPNGDGPAIDFPFDPPVSVDLLTLTPENAESLLSDETVPAGEYNWLELDLNADFDSTYDSYVTTLAGGDVELQVPTGSVRLVSGFTVTADQETQFTIDWDTRLGLVAPVGQPGYMLRPALRVIDMTEFGTLSGVVALPTIVVPECSLDDTTDLDVGNVVYIYAGHDVVPDDIDATDPEPVATAGVGQNTAGDYVYGTILSPGQYTVAFTCQSGNDDPETDDTDNNAETDDVTAFTTPANVTIVAAQEETVDF